jgi:hypothetical protein
MDATGVPVTLTYIDPNNNTYTMGQTTSDITGQFTYNFTPTVTGTYTIIATFAGSNSYYGSTAETHLYIGRAETTSIITPTPTPTSVANAYFVPAIAGIFVLMIIGFAVLAILALRKKP